MALNVACPNCQASYSVPENVLGKKVRCKRCGESFQLAGMPPVATAADIADVQPAIVAKGTVLPAATLRPAPEVRAVPVAAHPVSRAKLVVLVLIVTFVGLTVIGAGAALVTYRLMGGGNSIITDRVTEANYNRLRTGLTLREVEAILGPGEALNDEVVPALIAGEVTPEVKGKLDLVEPRQWREWRAGSNTIIVGLSEAHPEFRASVLGYKNNGRFLLDFSNTWRNEGRAARAAKKPDRSEKQAQRDPEKGKASQSKTAGAKSKPTEEQLKKALTKENYEKLKKGMTEKEVVAILGPPSARRVVEQHAGFVSRQLTWQLGQPFIIVVFHNGKVDAMDSGDGNGGPLPSENDAKPDEPGTP
jgi:predicted Zn finger-like uncharacterized protein